MAQPGRELVTADGLLLAGGVVLAVVVGFVIPQTSLGAIALVLVVPALYLLVRYSWVRLGWFVFGGMAVFQLADGAGAAKYGYMAGVVLCAVISGTRLLRDRQPWRQPFRMLVPVGLAVTAVLAIGIFIGVSSSDPSNVIRDALPYALVVLGPIIGIDAARELSTRALYRLTAMVGVAASLGFATDWLTRRGVSALPFGRFLLATFILGALGFAVALVLAANSRGWSRAGWIAAATIIPLAYLITGTRTSLVLIVVAIGVMGSAAKYRVSPVRLIAIMIAVGAAMFLLLPRIAAVVIADPRFLDGRIQAFLGVLNGTTADLSLQARQQSYAWATDVWQAFPIFGSGPGYVYPGGATTLDTPILVLAKWGVLGAAVFACFVLTIGLVSRRIHKTVGFSPANAITRGFLLFIVALTPFGGALEDKGFALALALLVAMLAAAAREGSVALALEPPYAETSTKREVSSARV